MATAEAGPSRWRVHSPARSARSSAGSVTVSPSRLTVEVPSPRDVIRHKRRRDLDHRRIFESSSPSRPLDRDATSPESTSTSPIRVGGFDHVVAALERAVDTPIERVPPTRDAETIQVEEEPIQLTPRSTGPLMSAPIRSPSIDPPIRSTLRLPQSTAPRPPPQPGDMAPPPVPPPSRPPRPSPPAIAGPIFVPPDVLTALTSATRSVPVTQRPTQSAALVQRGPRNRAYVSIPITLKRRAELIARGVYDAFRDDEDAAHWRPRVLRRMQHTAFGAGRIMLQNRPVVIALPEELPARFLVRPGPALLEPYASLLTEDTLMNTLGAYPCGWKGCGAVLGSERLLAKHVAKRAHAAQGAISAGMIVYRCFWAGCEGPCFEAVEGLVQHLAARHICGRLRCPYMGCDMTSPTLAHLQRHVLRQHNEVAPMRPRANAPNVPLPRLPPLPQIAHADELSTQRVPGQVFQNTYRQDLVRARVQRLSFGGPEPDEAVGSVTMMEQLSLTPQPGNPAEQVRKPRKRKNFGWGWKAKVRAQARIKTESDGDVSEQLREAAEERTRRRVEEYERRRLGRVWVEIPVRDPSKAGIYERPDTPPRTNQPSDDPPVLPAKRALAPDTEPPPRKKRRRHRKRRKSMGEASAMPPPPESSILTDTRNGACAPVPAEETDDGDSEVMVDLTLDSPSAVTAPVLKPRPPSATPSAPRRAAHVSATPARATPTSMRSMPNGTPSRAHIRSPTAPFSASQGRIKPRLSVEVVPPPRPPRPMSTR